MAEPTVLIIGAGTFGTSTAYHLAQSYKDASRVTIIDRWAPLSSEKAAAAIDVNRIIYTDYISPLYCNLANEAIHPWFWSLELGHYFHKTGLVVLDERDSGFAERVRKTFHQRGSDYTKDVDMDYVRRWEILEGMKAEGLGTAYFNPEAGWAEAASATVNFMTSAEKGVRRVTGEVEKLVFDLTSQTLVGVRTKDGKEFKADQILLMAGAWTSQLLAPIEDALHLAVQDRIERQIQAVGRLSAYYTLSTQQTERMCEANMPILVYKQQAILTPPSRENRTLKINDLRTEFVNMLTTKTGHHISVPSDRHQEDVPIKLKNETEELVLTIVPQFARSQKPSRWRVCWDAKTPTGDWLICKHHHPQLHNLYFAVGGNFCSYKAMPIVGKYVCNMLNAKSNGVEKDVAWGWKTVENLKSAERKQELGFKSTMAVSSDYKSYGDGNFPSRL